MPRPAPACGDSATTGRPTGPTAGPRWEYRIESFLDLGNLGEQERRAAITAQLNEWGQEGWELVSVVVGPAGGTGLSTD